MEKITKRDYFKMIREVVENRPELVEFIDHELELLDKKASKSSQTKVQKENEGIKVAIVEALAKAGNPVTVTELQKDEKMAEFSNQKLSALLKQLVATGEVVKVIEKGKSYFSKT